MPFYLSQIFYLQRKYTELLAYAPAVLDSAPPKRADEIEKLIGNAYYELGEYKKALPYLENYIQKNQGTKEDYYQMGLAYFNNSAYEQSIQAFQKSIGKTDTLSQSAYYYIGEANIKTDNKREAKEAFRSAYKLAIDQEVTEDALFNYAKTAYELSYHPYDDAIIAFEEFINTYPNSPKLNDAYEYLVGVYYTTKNYEEALKSIDRIKSKDIKLLKAKQRLAYYRGVELFNSKDYLEAVAMFQLSLNNNYSPKLKATASYWMAEAFHRIGDYDNADNYFSNFLSSSGARQLEFYEKGYYSMAYTHYERKKYKSAIFWFREYVKNAKPENLGLINDANLRTGDSYFIQKDYRNAIIYYDQSLETGIKDEDYAGLQSAICSGILGDYQLKVKKLEKLIKNQKESIYVDDALFELGKTYLILGKSGEALSFYNQLINDYPASNYLAETHLKIGLIHYNAKKDDLALNSFDRVVKNYSGTSASREALDKIRKIYIDKGDAQAFQNYINGVPFADISKNELDSTSYVIAENAYLEGKCEKATRDFTNYLKQYPKGLFSLNAHYYRGDCEAKAGFNQEAVNDLEYVVRQTQNKFTEKSLVALGRLYKNLDSLSNAKEVYQRLITSATRKENLKLAEINLMNIHFRLKEFEKASEFANLILKEEVLEDATFQQAHLILAKSSFENENYQKAIVHLNKLKLLKNRVGAESKYMLAKTYYLQGKYEASDSLIFMLVDQVPSFPYWIAKGFILLADNFIAKEDVYNARLTFQSVIDNADDKELVSIAQDKLKMLNDAEEREMQKEDKVIEIEMGNSEVKNKVIFETDTAVSEKKNTTDKEESDEK